MKAFHFYQETTGFIQVNIIVEHEFSDTDQISMNKILEKDTNNIIMFSFKKVEKKKKKKSGKREIVIQNIV